MTVRLGIAMDPIESINIKKDSSFAMLLAAQRRGWSIDYFQINQLVLRNNRVHAFSQRITVEDNPSGWYHAQPPSWIALTDLDLVLMRKDPPFDMDYIYATYLLELAESQGCLIVNKPQTLRDANEKFYTCHFPQCCPENLVAKDMIVLKDFITEQEDVILKPLHGMGGQGIFRVTDRDPNLNVILETMTERGHVFIMAQKFIPDITRGDKRILLVGGQPVPYALARIPTPGETRGNLAAGGTGQGQPLTDRDRWIAEQVGPTLNEKGVLFAGIDVIGDYLTEINITSPTCIRELDQQFGLDIAGDLMDCIAARI